MQISGPHLIATQLETRGPGPTICILASLGVTVLNKSLRTTEVVLKDDFQYNNSS